MNNLNEGAAKAVKEEAVEIANQPTGEIANQPTGEIANEPAKTLDLVKDELKNRFTQFEEKANVYKEKVSDNLTGAAETVHEKSDSAQNYLNQKADNITEFTHQKADSINDLAHQTIGKANQLGHRAAEALNSSSDYLRNLDFEEARAQLKTTIQHRPELSIAVAGIFGLMLGLLIGKRAR